MKIKGIYENWPALPQIGVLLLSLLVGAIVSSLLSTLFLLLIGAEGSGLDLSADALRTIQFVSAIGSFLLPAALTAWLCSGSVREFLSLRGIDDGRVWILALGGIVCISPAISLLGALNQQMELPASLAPVEAWMRAQEDLMARFTEKFLTDESPWALPANLLVVAATAALTEEFLFRGCLQRLIGRCLANPHAAVWITAIVFSAFHLQFYGFIPRMVLGAYLGYLLVWTRSLWIPVFAHFVNNAVAVVGMSDSHLKDSALFSNEIPTELLPQFSLAAAFSFLLFLLINRLLIHVCRER